ncbi:UNVERIFIED_CONTAM: hypothetical protein K2H54_004691 [Gekko kuhli]
MQHLICLDAKDASALKGQIFNLCPDVAVKSSGRKPRVSAENHGRSHSPAGCVCKMVSSVDLLLTYFNALSLDQLGQEPLIIRRPEDGRTDCIQKKNNSSPEVLWYRNVFLQLCVDADFLHGCIKEA